MDDLNKNKFFILLRMSQIKLVIFKEDNQILFEKDLKTHDRNLEETLTSLKKFLENSILDLEKKFKFYIKDINLIIDHDYFIFTDVSTINNYKNISEHSTDTSSYLVNIKDNILKSMKDYNLIHMIINRFIVDGKDYPFIPKESNFENIFLEIKFILLDKKTIKNLKKIFSRYEIYIDKIFNYEYVNNFRNSKLDNIFDLADKLGNGLNQNEIIFIKKTQEKRGFFEKFFNFFR
tara:strand:- start:3137 stop:3838 length:702 start_codon:yes stop_codon:yes gene_type:complete